MMVFLAARAELVEVPGKRIHPFARAELVEA